MKQYRYDRSLANDELWCQIITTHASSRLLSPPGNWGWGWRWSADVAHVNVNVLVDLGSDTAVGALDDSAGLGALTLVHVDVERDEQH